MKEQRNTQKYKLEYKQLLLVKKLYKMKDSYSLNNISQYSIGFKIN
mgnify:CR=1 FL=1